MLIPCGTAAQALKDQLQKGGTGPLVIQSKTLEVNDAAKTVTFRGEVVATKDEFEMSCAELVVHYENPQEKSQKEEVSTRINRIAAKGGVRLTRAQGGTAAAEEAVYYQQDEKVVLTGNPVVKQGNDSVEGDRIIILLKENRSIVEGAGDKKAKAVIFQDSAKRKVQ
jgi:lipopolysaccharide export system protein LptA